jgi:hypothetical protein
MIRRALLVAAAAVALIFVPSVAMAYEAPGFRSSVSDPMPRENHPFTVTINGGVANAGKTIKLVTTSIKLLYRAKPSTMSLSKKANASGVVKFTYKLSACGTYSIKAFNAAGALVSSQVITIGEPESGAATNTGKNLSDTGFEGMPLAIGGGVLVLAGIGAVFVAKRRRSAQTPA